MRLLQSLDEKIILFYISYFANTSNLNFDTKVTKTPFYLVLTSCWIKNYRLTAVVLSNVVTLINITLFL